MNTPPAHTNYIDMAIAERRIAEAAVITDIESFGASVPSLSPRAWDVRHMLDPREHAPPFIDMCREALAYAEWRGLVCVLERAACGTPALVRIVRDAA